MEAKLELTSLKLNDNLPDELFQKMKGSDGASLLINKEENMIFCGLQEPTDDEIAAFTSGNINVGINHYKDAIFIILNFANVSYDLSYNYDVGGDLRGIAKLGSGFGYAWSLILFDSLTGIIKGLRYSTTSPKFSKKLEEAILKSEQKYKENRYNFNASFTEAMKIYPSPETMWNDSLCTEIFGKSFK